MNLSNQVNLHQLETYFIESKRSIAGSIILSFGIVYILYTLSVPLYISLIWFAAILTTSLVRLKLSKHFLIHIKPAAKSTENLSLANLIVLTITSLVWSSAYIALMYYGDNSFDLIAILILIGFIGSSIFSAGAYLPFYLALNLIPTVIAFVYYFNQANHIVPVTAPLILLAILFIFSSAYRYAEQVRATETNHLTLQQAKNDIIKVLGSAGEYRDEDTGNHILRMSHSCYLLAKEIGIDEERAREIESASTLHDVGKIGIPDKILLKPGPLDDAEREIMNDHTAIGYKILDAVDSPVIDLAKIITMTHHEKWDGSGYPHGLQGEQIPIEGRIAAICDVFDALTSERPYKKPWSHQDAAQYLLDHKGTHFDPKLVESFINILPEIISYRLSKP
ncbi:HD-GYP domain-containing protein [Thiomicrorhabdus sediminis]|uniref:HD domain-containing protein n=1 Tax=Thiomicrorhabdus sediminis TaxID=2580412 RepID=A0A4P9K3D2_9GAMM|nr:HD domain-containing phosphohydrolase [Thiomicrorhabdus sediminis]QCU89338.1 HD domain-containing protein [Thiomicrorhabdus sediminis]